MFKRSVGCASDMRRTIRSVAAATVLAACIAPAQASPVTDVNAALIASIRASATPPPVASRAIAMVQIAMFDAVNAASGSRYRAYGYGGGSVSGVSPSAAAYAAGYDMLAKLFPARAGVLIGQRDLQIGALGLGATTASASLGLGGSIASSFYAARAADGASTAQLPYVFGSGPGAFVSTVSSGANPLLPGWGEVSPFVLASGSQFRLAAPPALGSAAFVAAYEQVRTTGCATCGTVEQQEIARFWADGGGTLTPPGHWVQIASGILASRSLSLMEEARVMAVVGASVADAAISAWDNKYSYTLWRPVTAINGCTLQSCGVEGEPGWKPLLTTPNFPSYASGHSTFSGAAAGALASFFGDDVSFCVQPDAAVALQERCFGSFSAAAAEAGISRIYGGIHYGFDNLPALAAGDAIGRYTYARAFAPVPEPGTWALLLSGAAMLGMALRRRRDRRALA